MTNEKLLSLIEIAKKEIREEGGNSGKIELIVRDGEVKHINVSYEMTLEAKRRYYHPNIPSGKSEN